MAPDRASVQDLIERAREARHRAYAPYSEYPVGAALLARSGRIFEGANVENAAYPTSMCAERIAAFTAVTQRERAFEAIAVVTQNGGAPCGACRQVLSEFGGDLLVIVADVDGKIHLETKLKDLIPHAFGPQDLVQP
ncbi:MAG: cytidine deaminase [Anaerolineae bacterium]|nr:MAG: cytidine deaminase [Anaerolineae bacterium]